MKLRTLAKVGGTPQRAGDTQATTDDGYEASDRSLQLNVEQHVNDGSGVEYRTKSGKAVRKPKRYNDYVKI